MKKLENLAKSVRLNISHNNALVWASEDLAYFHAGKSSFLLQRFYVKEHADNFMMHMLVEDVKAWWRHVSSTELGKKYGVRVLPPADRPWGIRDFTVDDPTGVLWRIGQNIESAEQAAPGDVRNARA